MSTGVVRSRFQFQRLTKDRLEALNPVLRDGELVIEKDTLRMKAGDGETPYKDLKYLVGSGGGSGSGGIVEFSRLTAAQKEELRGPKGDKGDPGVPGNPGLPGKDGAAISQAVVDGLNAKIADLLKRIEALEKAPPTTGGSTGGTVSPTRPVDPVPSPKPSDNSAYPVITDKNDFYTMDTMQAVKIYHLLDAARYNATKINNTLSKTNLGAELGISGLTGPTVFQSSKAYRIANSYIQNNDTTNIKNQVANYVTEANG